MLVEADERAAVDPFSVLAVGGSDEEEEPSVFDVPYVIARLRIALVNHDVAIARVLAAELLAHLRSAKTETVPSAGEIGGR